MKKSLAIATATLVFASGASLADPLAGISDLDSSAPSEQMGSGWKVKLGLGAVNAQTFPGVDDSETNAVPLINISYNDTFYLKLNRLGVWIWKPDNTGIRLGAVAKIRKGYDRGDGPYPNRDVDNTGLVGVRLNWKSGRFAVDGMLLGSSESDSGGEAELKASYSFHASQTGSFTGFVKVELLSEDAVDYFYYNDSGDGDSATISSLGVLGTYQVTPQWTLIGSVMGSVYSDEIEDSPGPDQEEDSGTTALVGITYTF